jgi:hypothetical protein
MGLAILQNLQNQIDPTIACCNICMGKALSDYQHPEIPTTPAETYWELSYGKEKSTTKLDQHLYHNHRELWKKHQVESLEGIKGPMDSFTSHSDDYFVKTFLRWIVEKALPISTGEDAFFRTMIEGLNKKAADKVSNRFKLVTGLEKIEISVKDDMKKMLKKQYFSMTADHWTSSKL